MTGPNGRRWLILLPAMVLPFLTALFYFGVLRESRAVQVLYAATKVFTLLWPWIALRYVLKVSWPRINLRERIHFQALPLGLLTGGLIVGLMFWLMQTGLGGMVQESAGRIRAKTETLGIHEHYWLYGLFLALGHSLLEEYYWRWFVYGQLREVLRPVHAHWLAGLCFSGHHIVVATAYFPLGWGLVLGGLVGIGGMIWSWLYTRQGTLAGAWLSHILVDFGILAVGHRLIFGTYF